VSSFGRNDDFGWEIGVWLGGGDPRVMRDLDGTIFLPGLYLSKIPEEAEEILHD